ncbi:hypothetical protein BDB01DRAFT_720146 [Pilobolus umbonatus]|nr:hypothetical protein BDB01DRAFT_720146 [Pilobolus umbonatus]
MLASDHYSTPPYEGKHPLLQQRQQSERLEERRASLVDPTSSRTLYPLSSFRHPYHIDSNPSPVSSRRGSLTDPILHHTFRPSHSHLSFNSPPSSPSSRRSSVVEPQIPTPTTSNTWRRESLPSITHLTHPTLAEYQFNPSLREDRRHSIATTGRKIRHSFEQAPYSRSPELRISHKLAERKRRKEMKDLFDDLRDLLPVNKGLKTSKWEILSKALEYIRELHEREDMMEREKNEIMMELNNIKNQ